MASSRNDKTMIMTPEEFERQKAAHRARKAGQQPSTPFSEERTSLASPFVAEKTALAEALELPEPETRSIGLLAQWTPDVVRATELDPEAEFDEQQEVHLKPAPFEDGQAHGDALVWREGALLAVEHFEHGVCRERVHFHPDGTWAQHYAFNEHGFTTSRSRQRGPKGSPEEFPKGKGIDPKAHRIEYVHDAHGMLEAFRCLDEKGWELSSEPVNRAADQRTEQATFASREEASTRWRAEGDEFKGALNAWLKERYDAVARGEEADWETGEPTDPRGDMERVVVRAIEESNAQGRFDELRRDFPPAFEPFTGEFWDRYARAITNVAALDGGALLVHAGDACFHVEGTTFTELKDVAAFGRCPNHRFIALAYADRVEVTDGWQGPVVSSFPYPKSYGWLSERFPDATWPHLGDPRAMQTSKLLVRPDGRTAVLVSREGIWSLVKSGPKLLYPQQKQLAGYYEAWKPQVLDGGDVSLELDFVFAETTKEGGLLACGARLMRGVLAQLEVFRWSGTGWVAHVTSFEKSMFPRVLRFHDTVDQVGFAPVLYATVDTNWSDSMPNTVFRFKRERLQKAGALDAFDGGLRQAPGIVNAIEPWGQGFLLGMRNQGYVWHMSAEEDAVQLGFLHLGGSIDVLEASADKAMLFVGTSCGQVVCLRAADACDPQLISDLPLTDERRYVFWKSFAPMVW